MRTIAVILAALLCVSSAISAQAERRMFIVDNDADGYGIDRCLSAGERCGAAAAKAYCNTQAFAEASTYHKADRNDITGAAPNSASDTCQGNSCNLVAIICTR
jgi:hypothetical protein